MYNQVSSVVAHTNFTLTLTYENGEHRSFDMKPFLNFGIFQELKNFEIFQTVKPCFDTVMWVNEADLDPEILYNESTVLPQNVLSSDLMI